MVSWELDSKKQISHQGRCYLQQRSEPKLDSIDLNLQIIVVSMIFHVIISVMLSDGISAFLCTSVECAMSTPLWSRACCQCRTSQAYHCVVAASREVWGWPGPMVCPNSKSYEECINLCCMNAKPMCFPGRYYPWKSNVFFVNSLSEKTIILLTMMSNQQFQWTFLLMILGFQCNVHNYDNHLLMFIEHNMYVDLCVMLLYHWRPGYLQDVYRIIEWFN